MVKKRNDDAKSADNKSKDISDESKTADEVEEVKAEDFQQIIDSKLSSL